MQTDEDCKCQQNTSIVLCWNDFDAFIRCCKCGDYVRINTLNCPNHLKLHLLSWGKQYGKIFLQWLKSTGTEEKITAAKQFNIRSKINIKGLQTCCELSKFRRCYLFFNFNPELFKSFKKNDPCPKCKKPIVFSGFGCPFELKCEKCLLIFPITKFYKAG